MQSAPSLEWMTVTLGALFRLESGYLAQSEHMWASTVMFIESSFCGHALLTCKRREDLVQRVFWRGDVQCTRESGSPEGCQSCVHADTWQLEPELIKKGVLHSAFGASAFYSAKGLPFAAAFPVHLCHLSPKLLGQCSPSWPHALGLILLFSWPSCFATTVMSGKWLPLL